MYSNLSLLYIPLIDICQSIPFGFFMVETMTPGDRFRNTSPDIFSQYLFVSTHHLQNRSLVNRLDLVDITRNLHLTFGYYATILVYLNIISNCYDLCKYIFNESLYKFSYKYIIILNLNIKCVFLEHIFSVIKL